MFMIQQIPLPEIVICVIKQMLYSYYKLKKKVIWRLQKYADDFLQSARIKRDCKAFKC